MNKEYKVDKEYSLMEIIRYNLRMWWLAVIFAVVCAGMLGGYKYMSLHQYVENELYENKQQVTASLFVENFNDGSVAERANNIIKIAKSSKAYDNFRGITGYELEMNEYTQLFEMLQGEASDVVSVYTTFPAGDGDFTIMDEESAIAFTNGVIDATTRTCAEMFGTKCVSVLDEPYATVEIQKLKTYSISEEDFRKAFLKAVTAGVLLGIIVEVVFYTFWMLIYKKPKNAEEVRECLDTRVIEVLKNGEDNEEAFKKVALFLKSEETGCNRVSCLSVQNPKKDTALKLAMSYANEQKKTLYVDLCSGQENGEDGHSISRYVLGEAHEVNPLQMNPYLDAVYRSQNDENGMDIAGNRRFSEFMDEMGKSYECIVVNSADASKAAEGYAVSKLCNQVFVVCGRKMVKNETLYRVKNTADVNDIRIDGVLIYDL